MRCPREVEQVCALSVVELQRPRERLEHGVGHPGSVAAFEAGVVVDADAGQQRHFFPPETWDAARAGAVGAETSLLGRNPRPPGGQELADLVARVHDVESSPLPRTPRGPASTWINRAGQPRPAPASVVRQALERTEEHE